MGKYPDDKGVCLNDEQMRFTNHNQNGHLPMETKQQGNILIQNALRLCRDTESDKVFLFLNSDHACRTLIEVEYSFW